MSRSQLRQVSGETFGARLLGLRAAASQTQECVARALGVSLRTYQRWESGASEPGGSDLVRLADHFSVEPRELYPSQVPA